MNIRFLLLGIICLSFSFIGCGDAGPETNPQADEKAKEIYDNPDYEKQMLGEKTGDKKGEKK